MGKKILFVPITMSVIAITYVLAVFTEMPLLGDARTLWIETAMTTGEHQWLATRFFPKTVIDKVMSKQDNQEGVLSLPIELCVNSEIVENVHLEVETHADIKDEVDSITTKISSKVGELDEMNNLITIDDIDNGIRVIEISEPTYAGKVIFVNNPNQVVVRNTKYIGSRGQTITEYLKEYDSIAGVNANGFYDPDGHGKGGDIVGWSMSYGEYWGGGAKNNYITMGFNGKGELTIGKIKDFEEYEFRDLVQFKPALIINGEIMVKGSAGWGIQPRTAIGQMADGTVMIIVIDGRQVGHSIGITVGDLAEIMYSYGVINAGCCDGGSSSVMAYDGKLITKPSTPMESGRYLPNAILVLGR